MHAVCTCTYMMCMADGPRCAMFQCSFGQVRIVLFDTAHPFSPLLWRCCLQGMNLLVAISLFHLDEESTFWCLVAILEKILPEDYYTHGLLASQADQVSKDSVSFVCLLYRCVCVCVVCACACVYVCLRVCTCVYVCVVCRLYNYMCACTHVCTICFCSYVRVSVVDLLLCSCFSVPLLAHSTAHTGCVPEPGGEGDARAHQAHAQTWY